MQLSQHCGFVEVPKETESMNHCTVFGIDLAEQSFGLHSTEVDGTIVFKRTLTLRKELPSLVEPNHWRAVLGAIESDKVERTSTTPPWKACSVC